MGAVGNNLLGAVELSNSLSGANYLVFLENFAPGLLDNIPFDSRESSWLMHD